MQLMNGGRVTHTDITGTDRIVAPSAIAIEGDTRLADGTKVAYPCRTRSRPRSSLPSGTSS